MYLTDLNGCPIEVTDLKQLGHDEQSVIESIIKKLQLNYGNDN